MGNGVPQFPSVSGVSIIAIQRLGGDAQVIVRLQALLVEHATLKLLVILDVRDGRICELRAFAGHLRLKTLKTGAEGYGQRFGHLDCDNRLEILARAIETGDIAALTEGVVIRMLIPRGQQAATVKYILKF